MTNNNRAGWLMAAAGILAVGFIAGRLRKEDHRPSKHYSRSFSCDYTTETSGYHDRIGRPNIRQFNS